MNKQKSVLEMLTELIGSPSVSCASPEWDQSNKGVIALLSGWLTDEGFRVEVMDVPGYPGKQNLIATIGRGSGGLVLSGHTDTVPFDDQRWQTDPFKLSDRDGRFYGLGTCDMKGFFALAIEAARGIDVRHMTSPLVILATADEESSMSGARALVEAGYPKARYAVIGEPTGLKPIRCHKGIMMESLRISGQSGHSSNPSLGRSALDCMSEVLLTLLELRKEWQQQWHNPAFEIDYPTMNLGHIHGGDNPNRICGHCELQFDVRPLPGMDIEALRGEIRQRVSPIAAAHRVAVSVEPLFPGVPGFESAEHSELVRRCEVLTGHSAESVAFATEAPFLQAMGMETLVMGPGSIDQAHQPNEFLAHDQINPAIRILRQLIQQICFDNDSVLT